VTDILREPNPVLAILRDIEFGFEVAPLLPRGAEEEKRYPVMFRAGGAALPLAEEP